MTSHIKCDILFTWMVSEMIAELSKRMSLFLCKKEIVEQEMAEVYQYGFEIIFSTLIVSLSPLQSALFFECFWFRWCIILHLLHCVSLPAAIMRIHI